MFSCVWQHVYEHLHFHVSRFLVNNNCILDTHRHTLFAAANIQQTRTEAVSTHAESCVVRIYAFICEDFAWRDEAVGRNSPDAQLWLVRGIDWPKNHKRTKPWESCYNDLKVNLLLNYTVLTLLTQNTHMIELYLSKLYCVKSIRSSRF